MNVETERSAAEQGRRVSKILDRARLETSVRDLVTFSSARIWTVMLALAAVLYALVDRQASQAIYEIGDEQ